MSSALAAKPLQFFFFFFFFFLSKRFFKICSVLTRMCVSFFVPKVGFVGEKFWFQFAPPAPGQPARVHGHHNPPPKNASWTASSRTSSSATPRQRLSSCSRTTLSCSDARPSARPTGAATTSFRAALEVDAQVHRDAAAHPRKQLESFQVEVYGVLKVSELNYFPQNWCPPSSWTASASASPPTTRPCGSASTPAGHSVSDMGICAIVYVNSVAVIVGCATVNVARSACRRQALLKVFLRLRKVVPPPSSSSRSTTTRSTPCRWRGASTSLRPCEP